MRAKTRKPLPSRQTLKEQAPPKRGPAKVVTIDAEIVKLHRHGAHPSYNEALATEILDQLAEGKTLRAICREPGMPSARTVRRWATDDINGFADRYERARKLQADALFDEAIDISNEEFIDNTEVQAARLKIDTRKWYIARVHPEKYGDRVEVTTRTEKLTDAEVDTQLLNLLETADQASLLKQSGARKLLADPQR